MLKDIARSYYFDLNYNCAESVVRAANDYYSLGLDDRAMLLVGGYGAGIQTGSACGAFLGAVAVLSMKYVPAKAHESADIKPVTVLYTEKLEQRLGSQLCRDIKPRQFSPEVRCWHTVEAACDILEETLAEYSRV